LLPFFSLRACHGFKAVWASGPEVRRGVNGAEQRQIAQLGTAVKVALRKEDIAARHHGFQLTSGLRSQNLLAFVHKWLATKL
jgi:hypothetical protein